MMAASPLESACFILARPVRSQDASWRLIAYDVLAVAEDEYLERTAVKATVAPVAVARAMERARMEAASIVVTHSHPLGPLLPSKRDLDGERLLAAAFANRIPDVPHGRLIIGAGGATGALIADSTASSALTVWSLDRDLVALDEGLRPTYEAGGDEGAFDRQVRAFGVNGQRRLERLRVAIVGLGGIGSVVVEQLSHLGVSSLTLIDPDVLELSNRNRVVGSTDNDVGRQKVEVAADMVRRINPTITTTAVAGDIRDKAIARRLLESDFVMLCTDSQGSRAVATQIAYQFFVPMIDVGVAIRVGEKSITHISGRVQMLAPTLPCLLCAEVLNPEVVRRDLLSNEVRAMDRYIVGEVTPQPAVISINSVASSLAVTMMLSAVSGIPLTTRYQRLRLESGIVSPIGLEQNPDCPWCSARGALGRGDSWPSPGRA
jgi:molybdopterin-synthase adenylyltransferase